MSPPRVNFEGETCYAHREDEYAHIHVDSNQICVPGQLLRNTPDVEIREAASREVSYLFDLTRGRGFRQEHRLTKIGFRRSPAEVVVFVGRVKPSLMRRPRKREKEPDQTHCNHHTCKQERELKQCPYCSGYYCEGHIRPFRLPEIVDKISDKVKDLVLIFEVEKGGHCCEGWITFIEEEKKKAKESLDRGRIVGKPSPEPVSITETIETTTTVQKAKPIFPVSRQISQAAVIVLALAFAAFVIIKYYPGFLSPPPLTTPPQPSLPPNTPPPTTLPPATTPPPTTPPPTTPAPTTSPPTQVPELPLVPAGYSRIESVSKVEYELLKLPMEFYGKYAEAVKARYDTSNTLFPYNYVYAFRFKDSTEADEFLKAIIERWSRSESTPQRKSITIGSSTFDVHVRGSTAIYYGTLFQKNSAVYYIQTRSETDSENFIRENIF